MIKLAIKTTLAATAVIALAAPAAAQGAAPAGTPEAAEQQLGNVHFATSCNEVAQRRFDRAMRYQHSFWYRESQAIFEDALKADPQCAIALWGVALSMLNNPHAPPPNENLPRGLAALQKAKEIGAKTPRERDFIDALLAFYADHDKIDHRTRVQSYLKAIEAVAQRYPDDDEAQIFYAITLNVAAAPTDKTYANQLKGAAILEPIFARQPQHPGVAHYLIHLYDYPAIADKGLTAATRYAGIAPSAPHAQHMPSHIFTRVGYWKESIGSNLASVKAAKADKEWDDGMHGMDYLVYAYLQLGQDKKARAVVDEMNATEGYKRFAGYYANAASNARYMMERADWKGAAELQVKPSPIAYADAMTHFARAMGAAHSGQLDAARADIAKLAELRDKLRDAKDAYWSGIVDIQGQIATAWVLYAERKYDEALTTMKAAADAEDKTEKHPVTPGPPAPARELLGAMLLERGSAGEALAAFEATLKKEPNRFNAYAGAAQAADRLGDKPKATAYYEKVVALAKDADSDRPAIAAAKLFLVKN